MVNSPIKWVGGKSRLRKKILSMMPQHDCYVEVFGGAAWVLLAKTPSKVEIFNDIDGDVVNFFKVIKEKPNDFITSFDWELVSREKFEYLRSQNTSEMSDIQRAHRFYYLIMACWGGEFNSPRFQTSVSDAGHGNRLIGALKDLNKKISPVHNRLRTVIIEQLHWKELIEKYDKENGKKILMYLDPPYPSNKCNYKFNMREWEDHLELKEILVKLKSHFILTSYDQPNIRELFCDFNITSVQFAAGMPSANGGTTRNNEIIVTNFAVSKIKRGLENNSK